MAAINEIVSKQAVDGVLDLDKALSKTDDTLSEILNTATALSEKFKAVQNSTKSVEEKQTQYNEVLKKSTTNQKQLSEVQKQRIKIQENQKKVLAQVLVSQENSNKILAKGKVVLQENNKNLRETVKQQRLINERLKEGQKDAAKITGAYQKLSAELTKQRSLAKDLAVAYGKNSEQYKKVAKDVNKLDKELKGIDSGLGQSQRKVGQYGDALGGLSPRFSGMINMAKQAGAALKTLFANPVGLVIAAVAGLGAIIGKAVQQAQEYQAANAELASVLGITRSETVELQKESQRLGASTAFSANEVANLQIEYARLGFSQNQIKAVTESTIALSIAAKSSADETAAFVGATIRGFGLTAEEAARVSDVAAKSFSKSALDFNKLNVALASAAPAAKASGKSLEFTVARLGKLADAGLDASTAGTSLRNMFLDLSKHGITWDEAMEKINNSTNKNKTAMDLFGKRGAVSALIMADQTEAANELEQALNDAGGAAQTMADEQLDTLDGSMKLLSSAWSGFLFAFEDGEGVFMKIWKGIIDGLTWFLSTWSKLINSVSSGFKKLTNIFKSEQKKQDEAAKKSVKEKDEREAAALEESKKRKAEEAKAEAEKLALMALAQKEADKEAKKAQKERHNNALAAVKEYMSLMEMQRKIEEAATKEHNSFMLEDEKEMLAEMAEEEKEGQRLFEAIMDAENQAQERAFEQRKALAEANGMSMLDFEKMIANERLDTIDSLLTSEEIAESEKVRLKAEAAQIRADIDDIETEKELENQDKILEKREFIAAKSQEIAQLGFDFVSALNDRKLAEVESALEKGEISEQEAAKRSAEINRKQAIADKASALFSIAINTAIAAMKVTGQTGIGAALAVPLVIAGGALQAATVLAKPIPEVPAFLDGTHGQFNTPSMFTIAEDNKTEALTLKTGQVEFHDKATLLKGNKYKGARVTSNPELEYIKSQTSHSGFTDNFSDSNIISKLGEKLEGIEKAVKNQPQPIYKNDRWIGQKVSNSQKTFLNRLGHDN